MNYYKMYNKETIDIIKYVLTKEEFIGFLKGNELKYRLRAGFKSNDYQADLKKAMDYYNLRMKEEKGNE